MFSSPHCETAENVETGPLLWPLLILTFRSKKGHPVSLSFSENLNLDRPFRFIYSEILHIPVVSVKKPESYLTTKEKEGTVGSRNDEWKEP